VKQDDYGPPRDDAERKAFAAMVCRSFALSMEEGPKILERSGRANLRIVREHEKPAGGLVLIPMGQWFGGKRVSMTGIAAVAVEPEQRGRGVAKRVLSGMLNDLHSQGVALSCLYPATQPLYRGVGYEQAGGRWEVRAPCRSLSSSSRTLAEEARALPIVRLDPGEDPRIRATYRNVAQRTPGWLDRNDFMWGRVPEWRGEKREGYAVLAGQDIAGYLFMASRRLETGHHNLVLSDFVAADARAARRLIQFLSEHRSLCDEVVWFGGPSDSILTELVEQSYALRLMYYWMLRIVDVRHALEQRGYSPALQGELHLEVHDPLIAANSTRFLLQLENGRATVKQGGKGRITLDVRALSALYSGFLSAESLSAGGMLTAPPRDLAIASSFFAGLAPSMPDMF
jgi:predicted acetyltransferase